jgi:hypothetical protein
MPVEPGHTSYRKPTAPPRRPRRDPGPAPSEQAPDRTAPEEPADPERPDGAEQD